MRDPIRVLVVGTGHMGSGIARLVLEKPGLELVGAYARRTERDGLDLGPAIGLDRDLGMAIGTDLVAVVERSKPQVAIQATCSGFEEAAQEMRTVLQHRIHVISIAEEMAYPHCRSPELAEEIHRLAIAQSVVVVGAGINPGFVLDRLVITLTGVCADIQSITARRGGSAGHYPHPSPTNPAGAGGREHGRYD